MGMRWVKIVGGVVAVLLVVVVGALVYVSTMDVEQFRGPVQTAAKDATGRDFTIAGPMDLEISLRPRIVAEDITLANADWGSRPEMVKVNKFEVVVSLVPLVFGQVNIVRVVLVEPDILLETDKAGTGNWVFDTAAAEAAPQSDAAPAASDSRPAALPTVDEVRIERGLLVYRDGISGAETRVAINSLTGTAEGSSAPLVFSSDVMFNDMAITSRGSVGPLANAADPSEPLDIDIETQAFGINITAKGRAVGQNVDVNVAVSAETLTGLKALAGKAPLPDAPLNLVAQIRGGAERLDLAGVQLNLGDSDLSGDASVVLSGDRPKITAAFSGQKLDLSQLLPADPGTDTGGQAPTTSAPAGQKKRVFPDDPLPVDGLRAADVDASLKLAKLITPTVMLDDASVTLKLENGRLSVSPVTASVAGSELSADLTLNASGSVPTLAAKANAPNLDIGALLNETGTTDLVEGTAKFAMQVEGSGQSVAAIMANLNGDTRLLMNEGRVRTQAFDTLVGGLSAVMGTMFSGKAEWTVLNCAASRFDIKQGVATSQIMLVDTEYSTVIGEGDMNLGQESLNLKVTPQAKSATLNVAVPVKVRGTFAEPSFAPDELATARRIGGLLGGLVFPPAALGALADMGTGDDNPCLKIASKGGQSQPAGQSSDQPAKSIIQDPKSAVEGVTRGLRGLLGGDKKD